MADVKYKNKEGTKEMNRDKQIQKVNDLYNSICCLLVYENRVVLNDTIDKMKQEIEKLKL